MSKRVMLMYPPGKLYQRGEDRAQCNIEYTSTGTVHACNDLGYIAAILKQAGYEVFLHDYEMDFESEEKMLNDILLFSPDLVFMSTTNATIYDDLAIVDTIFNVHPCLFVMKAAVFYDIDLQLLKPLDLKKIACLIGGEVEFVIESVCDFLLKGKGDISLIPGILYQENNRWKKTAFHCWNDDLDALPFPDRSVMNNELYVRPDTNEALATISVARGCPSKCIYCMTPLISGKKVRFRSVENVFAEIEECYYQFGIKSFFFKADTFTINQDWAMRLCDKIISSSLYQKIEFTANARADTLSVELLDKMKLAGCFMLAVGFESGSDKSLQLMKKNTTYEQNVKAAAMIKEAGIPLFGFFMLGFPWETEEDLKKTIKMIFKMNPDFIEISMAMPYYGTELFEKCVDYGVIQSTTFGYDFFFNPNTGGTRFVSLERIKKIRKRAILRFYLRPQYIVKKFIQALSKPIVMKNYVKYGFRLLRIMRQF